MKINKNLEYLITFIVIFHVSLYCFVVPTIYFNCQYDLFSYVSSTLFSFLIAGIATIIKYIKDND